MKKGDNYSTELEIKNNSLEMQIRRKDTRIQQLEDRLTNERKSMMAEIDHLLHIEEMARSQSQLILDKDSRQNVLGSGAARSSVPTEDLIRNAISSYKKYCEKRTNDLKKVALLAEEKSVELEEAYKRIQVLEETIKAMSAPEAGEGVLPSRQKEIAKRIAGGTEDVDSRFAGKSNIVTEDEEDSVEPLNRTQKIQKDIRKAKQREAAAGKADPESEVSREEYNKYRVEAETLMANDTDVIKVMGSTGMSVSKEIKDLLDMPDSTFNKVTGRLVSMNIISKVVANKNGRKLTWPNARNPILLRLTTKGGMIYKILTKKIPEEPEMDRIIRAHAGYEHGYGIKACKDLFDKTGRFQSVDMWAPPRPTSGGAGYRPDLETVRSDENGNTVKELFEYERCEQHDNEYFAKFYKMADLTDGINVIVHNEKEHTKMQMLLARWSKMALIHHPEWARKIVRLASYQTIAKNIADEKPFEDWWFMVDRLDHIMLPEEYAT